MKTLFTNANVALPGGLRATSVLIDNHQISAIGPPDQEDPHGQTLRQLADQEIDAQGLLLMPGVIDDQVHFREPGLTHKEDLAHASRACAKGGVTSFLEMPNTIPNTITGTALEAKLAIAQHSSLVNYGFYIGATTDNLKELQQVSRTPGIKIFIGSSTGNLLVDSQSALERIFGETDLPICAHCEDESTVRENMVKFAGSDVALHSQVRNHEAALIATKRAIDLALRHNHPFHVLHVSTADEIPVIRDAGPLITAEVCPHHLFFNIDDYQTLGSLVKMNPSIKTRQDNERLWQALLDGDIDIIATDHAPHTLEEKRQPYPDCPSGLPAVENSLALMLNQVHLGNCSLEQVVEWMCHGPARIWHLKNKGRIEVGYDADLVLVDLNKTLTVANENQQTKCGWTPWHGTALTGWPVQTWVRGQKVFHLGDDDQPVFDTSRMGAEIEYERGS